MEFFPAFCYFDGVARTVLYIGREYQAKCQIYNNIPSEVVGLRSYVKYCTYQINNNSPHSSLQSCLLYPPHAIDRLGSIFPGFDVNFNEFLKTRGSAVPAFSNSSQLTYGMVGID